MGLRRFHLFLILGYFSFIPYLRGIENYNYLWALIYFICLSFITLEAVKTNIVEPYLIVFFIFLSWVIVWPAISGNISITFRYFEISQVFAFFILSKLVPKGKEIQLFRFILIVTIIVSVISLKAYIENPYVARSIKSSGSLELLKLGIGDYAFVYYLTFLTICILYRFPRLLAYNKNSRLVEIILKIVIITLFSVTVFYSNYATASIILLAGFIFRCLGMYSSYNKLFGLIVLLLALLFLIKTYDHSIITFLENNLFRGATVSRAIEVIEIISNGYIGDASNSRLATFTYSFSLFTENPIFGTVFSDQSKNYEGELTSFGQHSMVLDTMALFGIFVLLILCYLIMKPIGWGFRKTHIILSKFTITVLFIILLTVNNLTASIGFAVFFIYPLLERNDEIY